MFILGITGPSGAGKTLACDCLEKEGFRHLNADSTARVVVEKGKPCLTELVKAFGKEILNADGTLNRGTLAHLAFAGGRVETLNEITFGYIIEEIKNTLKDYEKHGAKYAVLDAPTLFESGTDKLCDKVLFVTAPKNLRVKRILERDNISKDAALQRVEAQPQDDFYKSRADFTVINDGGEKELKYKMNLIINIIKSKEDEDKNAV